MTQALLQTTVVGSYPQPDWLVNRALLAKGVPRTRLQRIVAGGGALPRAGAGRRHPARHPRHGAGRHRHHHRRRNAARELLQPLRHGAGGDRRRASGRDRQQPRPEDAGAEGGRQGPADQTRRGARHAVPARQHREAGQDHPARSLHHGPAGQGRVLQGRRGDVHGLRRRGERGGARAGQGRRRRDPARRAVAAQQSRGGQALRGEGDQPRAGGHHRADGGASLLRLRRRGAGPASRPATPSCRSSPTPSPSRSRSNRRSPSSTSAC